MKLLVGLGNPGDQYARHRHNVGFLALDRIAERHRLPAWKKRFQGLSCEGTIADERVLLLKPATFMNESGRSVGEALRYGALDLGDLIVFHDELDIEPGRVKVKAGGGNAGHNGLRSISAHAGNDYHRVRIGIGHPGHKDAVSGYVLHDLSKAELAWLDPLLDAMADGLPMLLAGQSDRFIKALGAAHEPAPQPQPSRGPSPSKPAASGHRHPAGERAAKQKSALAENLRKWMAKKDGSGE